MKVTRPGKGPYITGRGKMTRLEWSRYGEGRRES